MANNPWVGSQQAGPGNWNWWGAGGNAAGAGSQTTQEGMLGQILGSMGNLFGTGTGGSGTGTLGPSFSLSGTNGQQVGGTGQATQQATQQTTQQSAQPSYVTPPNWMKSREGWQGVINMNGGGQQGLAALNALLGYQPQQGRTGAMPGVQSQQQLGPWGGGGSYYSPGRTQSPLGSSMVAL